MGSIYLKKHLLLCFRLKATNNTHPLNIMARTFLDVFVLSLFPRHSLFCLYLCLLAICVSRFIFFHMFASKICIPLVLFWNRKACTIIQLHYILSVKSDWWRDQIVSDDDTMALRTCYMKIIASRAFYPSPQHTEHDYTLSVPLNQLFTALTWWWLGSIHTNDDDRWDTEAISPDEKLL